MIAVVKQLSDANPVVQVENPQRPVPHTAPVVPLEHGCGVLVLQKTLHQKYLIPPSKHLLLRLPKLETLERKRNKQAKSPRSHINRIKLEPF